MAGVHAGEGGAEGEDGREDKKAQVLSLSRATLEETAGATAEGTYPKEDPGNRQPSIPLPWLAGVASQGRQQACLELKDAHGVRGAAEVWGVCCAHANTLIIKSGILAPSLIWSSQTKTGLSNPG